MMILIRNIRINRLSKLLCFLGWLFFSSTLTAASISHLDVEVWGEEDALFVGYCQTPGVVGCDLDGLFAELGLPEDGLPIEAATGKLIFLADFQDLSGGEFKTKNPGFLSIRNALLPNELLSYRALGHLRYWDASQSTWIQAPQDVQIALYGGLAAGAGVTTDYFACSGQLLCFNADNFSTESNTVFSGDGISGNQELVIDVTSESGILHTHLSFFLENRNGEPGGPTGAYLVEMQLLSNARSTPGQPFLILINGGLDNQQLSQALASLSDGNNPVSTVPENPIIALSIKGDVDLDGDVDRIDIALILLAAQNQDSVQNHNVMFDVDSDGLISRQDSHLAKELCSLRLCQIPSAIQAVPIQKVAVFDTALKQLTLNDVQVDKQHYQAVLQQSGNDLFTLQSADPADVPYTFPAYYEASNGLLEIPVLSVNNEYYQVTLRNIGDFKFQLESVKKIDHLLN